MFIACNMSSASPPRTSPTTMRSGLMRSAARSSVRTSTAPVPSTLGPREVFKQSSMLHDSARATTRAMNRAGVKRLVVLSAAAHFPGIPNRIASFIMRNHMRDSLAMEEIVRSNGLEWTIARPPRLTQDDYVTYRSREDAAPKMGFTLSRKAVAAFMLDAIEQHEHVHKIVGIAK